MTDNVQRISTELRHGKPTTVIWEINGWNTKDNDDFDLIKSYANCLMDIHLGDSNGLGWKVTNSPQARLQFYFRDHVDTEYDDDADRDEAHFDCHYLALHLAQIFSRDEKILKYDFLVEHVDEELQPLEDQYLIDKRKGFNDHGDGMTSPIRLTRKCLLLKENEKIIERPVVLRLRITVTPVYLAVNNPIMKEEAKPPVDGGSLGQALHEMFAADDNYADLKIETKDGMTLNGHKFLLAARSPVLRHLVEEEVMKTDFTGTIKLEVSAKPMIIIRHWIYTEQLLCSENLVNCMEEVVEAAVLFQLTGLVRILDRELVKRCSKDNMFQWFQIAEKYGMTHAATDIKKFIKENL